MLFNSVEYLLLFLPSVFCIYFLLNKFKLYSLGTIFLLTASLFFYGSYKLEYLYILVVSIIINYFFSLLFKRNLTPMQKNITLILALISNIGILLGFKYFLFIYKIYSLLLHAPFNAMEYIMPLGISFFTLQQISYIIDCYKGEVKDYNFFDYALYITFFPQLVAGPIVRHQEMIPQFNDLTKRVINQQNIFIGLFLITIGLLKKVVLADHFTPFIDHINQFKVYSDFYLAWFFSIAKVFQGYFDFSGYCDIALGSAFLFNISLPWNFNSPYKSHSIIDYWSRWNMTLIRFFKDYVYNPLMKKSTNLFASCINIMIVFFLYGLWQGSNLVNIVYGILNGILVCFNKIWIKFNINIPKIISICLTFITLLFLSAFIGTDGFNNIFRILKSLIGYDATFEAIMINGINLKFFPTSFDLSLSLIIFILCIYCAFFSKNSTELAIIYAKKNNTLYTIILAVILFISTLFITKSSEFIYFNF